jgi:selenocysteine lyase/cysteine desulfurase
MVLSERLSAELKPTIRGYWNAPPSQSLRYGHLNYPGIYVLNASLSFMGSLGWDDVHARVMRLAAHTLSALKQRGFDVVTPDNAHAGIVSIRHASTSELVESLAASGVQVEDGAPYLRVSPHFYNNEEDIDRFLNALVQLNERRRYG